VAAAAAATGAVAAAEAAGFDEVVEAAEVDAVVVVGFRMSVVEFVDGLAAEALAMVTPLACDTNGVDDEPAP
jgi:hypothetical protein